MANNKGNSSRNTEKERDYYKLNTSAIDRLVNADKQEIPQDKKLKDPAKQYRSSFLDKIPDTVKALFIKFWVNGAVCFFILWGLTFGDFLDEIIVVSVVMGMVTDILTNNALRFIETIPGCNSKWMMFPQKKYWTFVANIIYAGIIYYCVVNLYQTINIAIASITGNYEVIYLGVEPLLFGIFYMSFDLLFISMKNLMKTIINDAKNKVNNQ